MFGWFRKNKVDDEMKLYLRTLEELNEKIMECNILYRALSACCWELYKYTGDLEATRPEFYIEKVKVGTWIE